MPSRETISHPPRPFSFLVFDFDFRQNSNSSTLLSLSSISRAFNSIRMDAKRRTREDTVPIQRQLRLSRVVEVRRIRRSPIEAVRLLVISIDAPMRAKCGADHVWVPYPRYPFHFGFRFAAIDIPRYRESPFYSYGICAAKQSRNFFFFDKIIATMSTPYE